MIQSTQRSNAARSCVAVVRPQRLVAVLGERAEQVLEALSAPVRIALDVEEHVARRRRRQPREAAAGGAGQPLVQRHVGVAALDLQPRLLAQPGERGGRDAGQRDAGRHVGQLGDAPHAGRLERDRLRARDRRDQREVVVVAAAVAAARPPVAVGAVLDGIRVRRRRRPCGRPAACGRSGPGRGRRRPGSRAGGTSASRPCRAPRARARARPPGSARPSRRRTAAGRSRTASGASRASRRPARRSRARGRTGSRTLSRKSAAPRQLPATNAAWWITSRPARIASIVASGAPSPGSISSTSRPRSRSRARWARSCSRPRSATSSASGRGIRCSRISPRARARSSAVRCSQARKLLRSLGESRRRPPRCSIACIIPVRSAGCAAGTGAARPVYHRHAHAPRPARRRGRRARPGRRRLGQGDRHGEGLRRRRLPRRHRPHHDGRHRRRRRPPDGPTRRRPSTGSRSTSRPRAARASRAGASCGCPRPS